MYTDHLKSMLKDFTSKIDVITKLQNVANSKLDEEHLKDVAIKRNDLKKAMKDAMKGDTTKLNNYIKNADLH